MVLCVSHNQGISNELPEAKCKYKVAKSVLLWLGFSIYIPKMSNNLPMLSCLQQKENSIHKRISSTGFFCAIIKLRISFLNEWIWHGFIYCQAVSVVDGMKTHSLMRLFHIREVLKPKLPLSSHPLKAWYICTFLPKSIYTFIDSLCPLPVTHTDFVAAGGVCWVCFSRLQTQDRQAGVY